MRIDAHQHFWSYSPADYPWMQTGWPIRRDYLPTDLAPLLAALGLDGSVAVQARQSFAESLWLLQLSDTAPIIKGVVGWVDLRDPRVEAQLEQFSAHRRAVGVRHVVQDEPDDAFMLSPDFIQGISQLSRFKLTYDLLVFPRQLPAAIALAQRFPNQPFVLDHLAKPAIRDGTLEPWRSQIQALAGLPNVMCKVSGMVTEANWTSWQDDTFTPYLEIVGEAFGPSRLMYGSDWPVCLLAAADYGRVYDLAANWASGLDPEARKAFLGGNAVRFYRLQP